jgi:hypothetical protein
MSKPLTDLLRPAFRYLPSVGQLQLWRLQLRHLIHFYEEEYERHIGWSSAPGLLCQIYGGWRVGLVPHRCFCTASTL